MVRLFSDAVFFKRTHLSKYVGVQYRYQHRDTDIAVSQAAAQIYGTRSIHYKPLVADLRQARRSLPFFGSIRKKKFYPVGCQQAFIMPNCFSSQQHT